MEILNRTLLFFATCGFVGYLPKAPGTWASVLGGILLYLFPIEALPANLIFVAGLVAFSVVCIHFLPRERKDPGYIVIDELAGMYVALAGHRSTIVNVALGFVFFRFFDIMKPFPVNKAEELKNGWGVVADDVTAGLYANCCLVAVGLAGRLW